MLLPNEEVLAAELERTRKALENRTLLKPTDEIESE
jgi:hypothetical protein